MNNKDKLIDIIVNGFRNFKGKVSTYCFSKDAYLEIIKTIILKCIEKNKSISIFIVVDSYNTRSGIMNYLKRYNVSVDNGYNIKCLSCDYVQQQYHYNYDLTFIVGVHDKLEIITKIARENKFVLALFTQHIADINFIMSVRKLLPSINTAGLDNAIKNDNVYSPVEEHRYGVDMSDDDTKLYDKYREFINTSVSIFGDLSTIERCKVGDVQLGISASEVRNSIAHDNGWREDLDTSIEFMKQIDDNYNPNVLFERACNFYNIAKLRRDLVSNNIAKLKIILDICVANSDKQILIISKHGEFASTITDYINNNSYNCRCGNYHDCIEPTMAIDDDGNVILVKSGANKGKPRIICSQAQSSVNERLFNSKTINVLSIKSSSNSKLKTACDIVIFTSPICGNIIDTKYRFNNVNFGNPTIVYRIYCNNTIEQEMLNKEKVKPNITIINETENKLLYDENTGDIIL